MSRRLRAGWRAVVLSCLVAACGGSSIVPPSSDAVPSSGVAAPGTIVGFDDTVDPSAASHRELDLVHELRDNAGMPALLGASGQPVFATLDSTEATFGFKTLREAATTSVTSAGGGGIASAAGGRPAPILAPADVDISLFADTGFTASAVMSIYADLVQNAGQTGSGSLTRNESHDETDANGNHQHVDLRMTMSVMTGGGKVSAEISMSATDRITGPDSQLKGVYTSSANGHFDVSACPDDQGLAEGRYSYATSHAMGDTGQAPAKADRGVSAPFKLIDDDKANLVRIEADMSLAADASGPGTAAGPGPIGAFDWQASDRLPISMPARGGSPIDFTGFAPSVTGTGAQYASGTLLVSAAMAQLFLAEVGKQAERFWRSGKCIDLKPSDDTRKVQPNERIDLTVKATGKFDHQEIAKPITAKFSGVKSLDPTGTPVDEPAKFTFTAGPNKDDQGTIDLDQTSKRGIGKRQIVFTVDAPTFQAKIDATVHQDLAGNVYDTAIHLKTLDLAPAPDGTSSASATVNWTTTYRPPTTACKAKTYAGTFQTKVTARVDPADPTRVLVKASFIPGVLKQETIECQGRQYPFTGSTTLGVWAFLDAEHAASIGGSFTINPPVSGGKSAVTVKITKKDR
jgi:hypothetical protein